MATLSQGAARPNAWAVRTREVVYMAIGAALYGVLGWATAIARIPGPFNVSARPAVVIPMFFGAIFGPWVGFFTGAVGNIIIDLLSGYGFSWNWSLGNGLLGLIAGLAFVRSRGDELPSLRAAIIWSVIGTLLAFLFSSVTDIWVYQTAPAEIPLEYFTTIIPNLIFGLILLPILYTAYKQFEARSGR